MRPERKPKTRCERRGHHTYVPCAERTDPKTGQRKLVRLSKAASIRMLQTHRVCVFCDLEIKA